MQCSKDLGGRRAQWARLRQLHATLLIAESSRLASVAGGWTYYPCMTAGLADATPRADLADPSRPIPKAGFRPDVEGLRAIAILAVVLYHAGVPWTPGGFVGVDIFFVISGFLITGLLLRDRGKPIRQSLATFYARRVRRILPAAVLVLVVTAIASWLILPSVQRESVGIDVAAAGGFVANIAFALQETDYLQSEGALSPVLHFWSLGVEEQFYFIWPWLLIIAAAIAASRPNSEKLWRWTAAAVLGLTVLVSFLLSLRLTQTSEPWAFFSSPTRVWQLGLGGLLTVGATQLRRVPRAARLAFGWAGLAAVLTSIVLITDQTPYPGVAALLPVAGTLAIIAAGATRANESPQSWSVAGVLGTAIPRQIGRWSYSWYLWHWPILVLGAALFVDVREQTEPGGHWPWSLPLGLALIAVALVPAVVSFAFLEQPIRRSKTLIASNPKSLLLGLALTAVAMGVGLGLVASGVGSTSDVPNLSTGSTSGPGPTGPLRPAISKIQADVPAIYVNGNGCVQLFDETKLRTCNFGDVNSPTKVVLFGDSHSAQFFPAMEAAAQQRGWHLITMIKTACPAAEITPWSDALKRPYPECDTWRASAMKALTQQIRPNLVVTANYFFKVADADGREANPQQAATDWKTGLKETLEALTAAGVPVLVIHDTPRPGFEMADCIAKFANDPGECDLPRTAIPSPETDLDVASKVAGASTLDLTERLCNDQSCPSVLDRIYVYRDRHHLTATYARSLAGQLGEAITSRLSDQDAR